VSARGRGERKGQSTQLPSASLEMKTRVGSSPRDESKVYSSGPNVGYSGRNIWPWHMTKPWRHPATVTWGPTHDLQSSPQPRPEPGRPAESCEQSTVFLFVSLFGRGSGYVAQTGLELMILLASQVQG
jgi:hypothetical protein